MVSPLHRRANWSADRGPVCRSTNIRPEGITAHYTGPSDWRQSSVDRTSPARFEATTDHNRCAPTIRSHRDYHMDARAGCFLFYNEVVCPHGHRYESRPPGERSGAQGTNDGNLRSYAVLYLAGQGDPLTDSAKVAFHDTPARFGVPLRWGHQDWKPTACPGDPVYAWRLAGFPKAGGGPIPKEDELTPEESDYLRRIAHAVIPFYQAELEAKGRLDGRFMVQPLVRDVVRAELAGALGDADFKKLIEGTVHKAVADVFAFAAGAKQGPIHDVIRQALEGEDKP